MDKITLVKEYAKNELITELAAHDFEHTNRVFKVATHIANEMKVNIELVQVAALVHDIIDKKVTNDVELSKNNLIKFLSSLNYDGDFIDCVFNIIENMSYSSKRIPTSIEGKIVQDADRIDAIGAISVARAFAYGGSKQRPIYDSKDLNNSIQHFYDKLLLLKDLLNTDRAKQIAEERHNFMILFLEQFFKEWNLEDIT